MNEQKTTTVPIWFWVVAGFALLWNLMGCAAFLTEIFAQDMMMATWTDEQKEWARSMPAWIYFEYAIAVGTGVAGSVFLLLRKKLAIPLFAVCSIAVIIQMVYSMLIARGLQIMGAGAAVMPCLVIIFSIVFLWFSFFSKGKGWLA